MNARTVRIKARAWMVENEIRNVDIEKELGMKDHAMVSKTLAGKKNHRRTLKYLLDKGCPKEFLALPSDLEAAA